MGESERLINVFLPQNPPEFADFRLWEGDRGGGGGIERGGEWEDRGEREHSGEGFLKRKRREEPFRSLNCMIRGVVEANLHFLTRAPGLAEI